MGAPIPSMRDTFIVFFEEQLNDLTVVIREVVSLKDWRAKHKPGEWVDTTHAHTLQATDEFDAYLKAEQLLKELKQ